MKKGKFIVIEGLDGCGKSTISEIITKKNNAKLLTALPTEIKKWMSSIEKTNKPEISFSYFTLCNILKAEEIYKLLENGENVILDRFFYTTYVYHLELLKEELPLTIKEFYKRIIKPDLVIFLDVPQKIRKQRILERNEKLQWFGDAVSIKTDLTDSYIEFFKETKTNYIIINNHQNSIEETVSLINTSINQLK